MRKIPLVLEDMRQVYAHPWKEGEEPRLMRLRKVLEEDTKGFVRQMTELEKAHALTPGEKPEKVDEGTASCIHLVEELLADWESGKARPYE